MIAETKNAIAEAYQIAFETDFSVDHEIEKLADLAEACSDLGVVLIGRFFDTKESDSVKLALKILGEAEELRGAIKDIENQI